MSTPTPILREIEVVGNYFRDEEAKALFQALKLGDTLILELEPENEFDSLAVKVLVQDKENKLSAIHLGYIPKIASAIFYLMDADALTVKVSKIVETKGKGQKVHIDVSAP